MPVRQRKQSHDDTSTLSDNNVDKYTFYGIGTRYYLGDFMFGLLYAQDKVTYLDGSADSTDKDYEATLVWNVSPDWALRTGYRHLKNEDGDRAETSRHHL